MKTWL